VSEGFLTRLFAIAVAGTDVAAGFMMLLLCVLLLLRWGLHV